MKRSKWQLTIPILIGLAIVPFSIREAYTQDEGGLEVMELTEDKKKPEPALEQQTTPLTSVDADSSEIFESKEVDVKPHLIDIVPPVYPEKAKKKKIEGIVTLQIVVNVDGSVSDVNVLEGPEVFHQALIDAALQFRFRPAKHNGKAVPVRMIMATEFSDTMKQQTTPPASGDADSSEVFEYKEVEVKPHPLDLATPVYPEKARKERIEGKMSLKLLVNVDGSVSDVNVLEGPEIFHQAAIDAISQSRFKPAEHNGKVVPVWMVMPIEFSLDSSDTDLQLTSPVPIDADGNEVDIPRFFEVEAPPELLQSVKSVYPPGVTVRLELKVNVDGSASVVKVLKGPEEFHQAAIDVISQYRFKPGTLNGKVVPVQMPQSIIFRLPKQQTPPPASGDADSSKVLEFFMVEVKPKVMHSVKPMYPEEALRDSLEGKVFLKFIVNLDGSVSDVRVLRGSEVFHQAAIDAVSQSRFKPAEHNGKPVAVWMTQPMSFRLPKQQTRQSSRSSRYVPPTASGHFHVDKRFSNEFISVLKVDIKPQLLHSVEPVYPEEALKDKVEGLVLLQCVINVDGSVSDVSVLKSNNTIERKEFHQAAIDAVSQYRYKPAEHNGKSVAVWILRMIRFRLPKE